MKLAVHQSMLTDSLIINSLRSAATVTLRVFGLEGNLSNWQQSTQVYRYKLYRLICAHHSQWDWNMFRFS